MVRDTVFFDLDGTLLPLDMDAYVAGFMELLTEADMDSLSDKISQTDVLNKSFGFMMSDTHEDMTNEEAYLFAFEKGTGVSKSKTKAFFDDFYENHFDKLRHTSRHEPISKQVVDIVKKKGYDVVLATNPVFAKTATYQRLEWAGIDKDDFSYISTFDNSCFCKPSLKYYQEILSKLGKRANSCYMVGNNVDEDLCSTKLGFEAFLLTDYLIGNLSEAPECEKGNYSDLLDWAKSLPEI